MATWPAKTNYATGDVLTAAQMNDIGGELNDLYTSNGFAAGKNKIINGDFGIWQRGTSSSSQGYQTADRWQSVWDGTGTKTISQQTFTAGNAPVSGYEGQYFLRFNQTVAGSGATYNAFLQPIEDVRTFAGQTVTLSFWAKAAATTVLPKIELGQNFGSGGSASVDTIIQTNLSISTTWTRYSITYAVPSVSGKTIGTSSSLRLVLYMPLNATFTVDIWGVQLEAGSTATPFQTATGTIQGELAACQRYYYRSSAVGNYTILSAYGNTASATLGNISIPLPVSMRVTPTSVDFANIATFDGAVRAITAVSLLYANPITGHIETTVASGQTQYRPLAIISNNNSSGYIGFSAEL